MDPNLDSLKTSGGPWRASSYHETGFCCKLLQRCPHSSLLGRHWRPLKAAGSLKKQNQKPNKSTLPQLHKQREQRRRSAKTSARSRNIPPLLWLSTLCTSAYFSSRGLCNAHISHRGEIPRPGCTNNIKPAGSPRFASERDGCVAQLSGAFPGWKLQAHMYALHLKKIRSKKKKKSRKHAVWGLRSSAWTYFLWNWKVHINWETSTLTEQLALLMRILPNTAEKAWSVLLLKYVTLYCLQKELGNTSTT